ncbi:probable serine/threonine protein kinase IREH1 isoform X2 [Cornus florida]|uniref:probable serine/threonine protein kinase IREH1 isoform X2 n=1 Tax=Cornus florida TaxID=4283 RepID=UPI00289E88A2|nr:probable serine/threonine protein kinase IREH1 isoform X2 [Cornus florida]
MVFKGRFFSSKKSDTSSPDGSNSPRSFGSNSPIRSEKKKVKSAKDDQPIGGGGSASGSGFSAPCRQTQVKDGLKQQQQSQSLSQQQQKKKDLKGKETQSQIAAKPSSVAAISKTRKAASDVREVPSSVSPILASSLGLNRIKTRSGPLPQESFFGFRGDKGSALGASNLSKPGGDGCSSSGSGSAAAGKKKESVHQRRMGSQEAVNFVGWVDNGSNSDSMSTESGPSRDQSPHVQARSRLQNGESFSEVGRYNSSCGPSGSLRSPDVCTPETSYDCENPKESESPRFQAILRVTSAPRKRFPTDIKSFSHELNSKGVRPFPFWKPRGLNNLEEVLVMIRAKFDKAKEEVDSDLHIFAADLVGILEKNAGSHLELQETLEDLLVLARNCAMTSPGEFWLQCEGIVQELDDRRQELPMGMLKQLHTRMLFILTRCTRLLQFHKESGLAEDEHVLHLRQSLHSVDKRIPPGMGKDGKSSSAAKASKATSTRKSYSQEQHGLDWKRSYAVPSGNFQSPPAAETTKNLDSPGGRDRMASWKKLPTPVRKSPKEADPVKEEENDSKVIASKMQNNRRVISDIDMSIAKIPELPPAKDFNVHSSNHSKHQHKVSWGHWGDQPNLSEESSIICRICEEEVPTLHVEDHSRICTIADRCDEKGFTVNDRLVRIAETLDKLIASFSEKDFKHVMGSPDIAKKSNSSVTEEFDVVSPKLSDLSRRGSEDMLDCFPEADNSVFMDDLKGLPSMSCRTRFGPKSDQGMTTSSAGSMTPRSPLLTPRTSQIDLLLAGKGAYSEHDDIQQMNELADIARCVANTPLDDDRSLPYLLTCLEDLRVVIDRRKLDALTVETFGARIEKLIREKYLQLCELVDDEKVDITSTVIDEDAPLEDDVVRSLRTSPIHSNKDRTSIDDFEIIKPISRGAFGRVFLAKKRTTGDLFAIKVRFFYSFTCRENLYLVMEYLNGGDLYSLLRNLGCLDEDVARVYIAEVVLALEYLHSLRVVHRDLKPDNLLIAHDGHIKLTDFGLSKVGLINSTDDLSGPAVSGTSLMGEDEPQLSLSEHQRERRKKRSAVGTPDYLAPEILLGTGHGTTADWWSVGVILFELIVGIPPFNAEHPQTIFDNILNRNIPWPGVSEEMSPEAQDLIDRLLTEDPNQRLGARGASEVKQHPFFRDINWDTLARQKAAFVPASESALDTSYFTSRYSWNTSDEHFYAPSEFEDSSDSGSISGSSSCLSNRHDEVGDECGGLTEFESGSSVNYSFSNFSFKNLSQLASINYDLLTKGWKDDPPANP